MASPRTLAAMGYEAPPCKVCMAVGGCEHTDTGSMDGAAGSILDAASSGGAKAGKKAAAAAKKAAKAAAKAESASRAKQKKVEKAAAKAEKVALKKTASVALMEKKLHKKASLKLMKIDAKERGGRIKTNLSASPTAFVPSVGSGSAGVGGRGGVDQTKPRKKKGRGLAKALSRIMTGEHAIHKAHKAPPMMADIMARHAGKGEERRGAEWRGAKRSEEGTHIVIGEPSVWRAAVHRISVHRISVHRISVHRAYDRSHEWNDVNANDNMQARTHYGYK